jgi:hypothetical protein
MPIAGKPRARKGRNPIQAWFILAPVNVRPGRGEATEGIRNDEKACRTSILRRIWPHVVLSTRRGGPPPPLLPSPLPSRLPSPRRSSHVRRLSGRGASLRPEACANPRTRAYAVCKGMPKRTPRLRTCFLDDTILADNVSHETILYARVSMSEQTAAHQLTMARAAGFEIDDVVADEGVSGVSTRLAERPQGRRLFDMLRHGDVLVVRWLNRLGRKLQRRLRQRAGVHAPRRHPPHRHQRPNVRRRDQRPYPDSRTRRAAGVHERHEPKPKRKRQGRRSGPA